MPASIHLQLLLATFAGWVHREQAATIAYLIEENRVLKEQLRGRRLRLTDDQRRRLAVNRPLKNCSVAESRSSSSLARREIGLESVDSWEISQRRQRRRGAARRQDEFFNGL